jgi:hypothetical protein
MDEDLGVINPKEIIKILKKHSPLDAIPEIVRLVHNNDKYPQYKNIYIDPKNNKYIRVYLRSKWHRYDKEEYVQEIYNNILEKLLGEFVKSVYDDNLRSDYHEELNDLSYSPESEEPEEQQNFKITCDKIIKNITRT